MERVTGIGGVFFRARDPQALAAWYEEHLGVPARPTRRTRSSRRAATPSGRRSPRTPTTGLRRSRGWSTSRSAISTRCSRSSERPASRSTSGSRCSTGIGRFGWAVDPEGNRFELWEPVADSRHVSASSRIVRAARAARDSRRLRPQRPSLGETLRPRHRVEVELDDDVVRLVGRSQDAVAADSARFASDGIAVERLPSRRVVVTPCSICRVGIDLLLADEGRVLVEGYRRTGCFAARTSSSRRTGRPCGASFSSSGDSAASRAIACIASTKSSSRSFGSVSVGSIMSASGTTSGK